MLAVLQPMALAAVLEAGLSWEVQEGFCTCHTVLSTTEDSSSDPLPRSIHFHGENRGEAPIK